MSDPQSSSLCKTCSYFSKCESGDPDGLLDGIDANVPVPAHVGMEDLGEEAHLGRVERVRERYLRTTIK